MDKLLPGMILVDKELVDLVIKILEFMASNKELTIQLAAQLTTILAIYFITVRKD
ncbi:MAG: hypothetical protein GY846_21240 [Deltaproteobacteria bacterium]|nr:hypothetical protein [Deltaproteobacteria bacterium]